MKTVKKFPLGINVTFNGFDNLPLDINSYTIYEWENKKEEEYRIAGKKEEYHHLKNLRK